MIDADKRKAILLLHEEGMPARQIALRLHLSRNAIRRIIAQGGQLPRFVRPSKQSIDPDLLRGLYTQCEGWIQRVHEKLHEEHGLSIPYPTLTRLLRKLGISKSVETRCDRVPDEPGAEMQHDTTVYPITLGTIRFTIVASLLYLRYSKRRYLQFYLHFNRFKMKCFLHQALQHWGYVPKQCIIDNTNLARASGSGTGKRAIITPEMEAFSKQYGFQFVCHEKNHPDRKAGEERSFWFTETNFLPARSFQSLEDLNQQALEWSTVRLEHRSQGKAKLIPAKAFEHEIGFLSPLSKHLPAPYKTHDRLSDQYGFIAFEGNYYWIPGTLRGEIKVLEYLGHLRLYRLRELVAEYPLAPPDVKNKTFAPGGHSPPRNPPHNRKQESHAEEAHLRLMGESVGQYLDFCFQSPPLQRHAFLRKLLALSRRMTPELFLRSVQRALLYRITSLEVLERIVLYELRAGSSDFSSIAIDPSYLQRPTYQEGSLTDPPNLSKYIDP